MKKKILIILAIIPLLGLVGFLGYYGYLYIKYPLIPTLPAIKVESNPENIERGRYLSNHVYVCFECHTERNWDLFSGVPIDEVHGAGGAKMNENVHPGTFYTSNITPAGLADWTDEEIFMAITCGINRDGNPLYWGMPYSEYNDMPQQDVEDIIAYLRSLKSIGKKKPSSSPNWDIWKDLRMMTLNYDPEKVIEIPSPSDTVNYGKYLYTEASCSGCHSHIGPKGGYLPESGPAGGYEFHIYDRKDIVRGANITPDSTTGIGSWSKQQFIQRFKFYETEAGRTISGKEGEFCSTMPWTMYAGMSEQDLGAIYEYLRTFQPIKHNVTRFTPGK